MGIVQGTIPLGIRITEDGELANSRPLRSTPSSERKVEFTFIKSDWLIGSFDRVEPPKGRSSNHPGGFTPVPQDSNEISAQRLHVSGRSWLRAFYHPGPCFPFAIRIRCPDQITDSSTLLAPIKWEVG